MAKTNRRAAVAARAAAFTRLAKAAGTLAIDLVMDGRDVLSADVDAIGKKLDEVRRMALSLAVTFSSATFNAMSSQSRQRHCGECTWDLCLCVLNGVTGKEAVFRRRLMIHADVTLIPLLMLNNVRQIIIEPRGTRWQRIGVD